MSKINYKLKAPHPLYGAEIVISKKQFNILPDNHKELFERGIFRKTYDIDAELLSLSKDLSRRYKSNNLSKPGNNRRVTYYHPEIGKVQIPSHTDIPPFPPFEFNHESVSELINEATVEETKSSNERPTIKATPGKGGIDPFKVNMEPHSFTSIDIGIPKIKTPESKYIKKSPWMSKKK